MIILVFKYFLKTKNNVENKKYLLHRIKNLTNIILHRIFYLIKIIIFTLVQSANLLKTKTTDIFLW